MLLALSTTYLAYVFRVPSGEWRRTGLGDWIDPYFINSVLEQWRFSATHLTSPLSPPIFYPAHGTLGYSHSLVLYAPFYIAARAWLDPLTAYTVTLFAIIEFGAICLYVVFRRFIGLGFVESLVAVALFVTSGNVVNAWTGVWSQRASVFLIPPILLLGLWTNRDARGWRRWIGLALSALLAVSLFTHDVYTGLLTALVVAMLAVGAAIIFGCPGIGVRISSRRCDAAAMSTLRRGVAIVALVLLVLSLAIAWQHEYGSVRHRHPGRALAAAAIALAALELARGGWRNRVAIVDRARAADVAAVGAGALVAAAIFWWLYAGAFSQHPGFSPSEMLEHLATVDPSAWRRAVTSPRLLVPYDSGRSYAIVLVLAVAAWFPWMRAPQPVRRSSLWFLLVTGIVLVLPVRVGAFAPWTYAFDTLPGFSAIRDPRRMQYPFELAIALAIGAFIAQLPRGSAPRRLAWLFVLFVIAMEWNPARFDYERPIATFERFVEAPIAVDASCRSFFVTPARSEAYLSRSSNTWALYANDAAFIAMKYGIPTLNGYSAWAPPDWHLFNPQAADYLPGVWKWVSLNRLQQVCSLDIERRIMSRYN